MKMFDVLISQNNTHECGRSVLRMMLALSHNDKRYLTLSLSGNYDNFLSISRAANKYGVSLVGYKLDLLEEVKNLKAPFVMTLHKEGVNHFVLAEYKKGKLHIADPSGDYYEITLKTVEKYFNSNILVVNCVDKAQRPPQNTFKQRVTPLLMHAIFLSFLIIGFAFLGHASLDLISYFSFTLAAIFKIIEQRVITKNLEKFDAAYIALRLSNISDNFNEKFKKIQVAKTIIFSRPLSLFSALSASLLITIILALNNYYFVIISALLIMLALFEERRSLVSNDKAFNLAINLSSLGMVSGEKRTKLYKKIIRDTTNFANRRVYYDIIIHFTLGVMIFILMYFTDIYTLNFFIFYFFGFSYYLYELKKLFRLVLNKRDYYTAINLLNDIAIN